MLTIIFSLQREHFKSEWHICNINRSLRGYCPLNFDLFETLRQEKIENVSEINTIDQVGMSPINSLSATIEANIDNNDCDHGTSSKTVTNSSLTASSHKQMLFFRNYNSEIVGINRCVLFTRKVNSFQNNNDVNFIRYGIYILRHICNT